MLKLRRIFTVASNARPMYARFRDGEFPGPEVLSKVDRQ